MAVVLPVSGYESHTDFSSHRSRRRQPSAANEEDSHTEVSVPSQIFVQQRNDPNFDRLSYLMGNDEPPRIQEIQPQERAEEWFNREIFGIIFVALMMAAFDVINIWILIKNRMSVFSLFYGFDAFMLIVVSFMIGSVSCNRNKFVRFKYAYVITGILAFLDCICLCIFGLACYASSKTNSDCWTYIFLPFLNTICMIILIWAIHRLYSVTS